MKRILLLYCCPMVLLSAQPAVSVQFFPETKSLPLLSADEHAHQMKVQSILFTKDLICSLGGIFPWMDFQLSGVQAQISSGASAHVKLEPIGQKNLVYTDFYVDYLIADVALSENYLLRLLAGHTSHHLSDQWYEALGKTDAFHYSRDYIELSGWYVAPKNITFTVGVNYGYNFHVFGSEEKKLMLHFGTEKELFSFSESMRAFFAADMKLRQEAAFASSNAYQIGIKLPMQKERLLRIAYEFRHGISESGQFFLQRVTRHTIGLFIEV